MIFDSDHLFDTTRKLNAENAKCLETLVENTSQSEIGRRWDSPILFVGGRQWGSPRCSALCRTEKYAPDDICMPKGPPANRRLKESF